MVKLTAEKVRTMADVISQPCSCREFPRAEQAYFDLIGPLSGLVRPVEREWADTMYSELLVQRFVCLSTRCDPNSCPCTDFAI